MNGQPVTAPDLRPTLIWLSVVNDAVAAGHDWMPDSERHLRTLPPGDAVAPRLFAVVLAHWCQRGIPPADAVQGMDELLNAAAISWGWH